MTGVIMKSIRNSLLTLFCLLVFSGSGLADSVIRGGEWGDATPAVAYNTVDHEYLVVWNEFMTVWPFFGPVMGRRLGPGGEKLGPPFKIFDSGVKPAVVYDPDHNRYCVVCESNFKTYLCFLDAGGSNIGSPPPYDGSTYPRIYYNTLAHNFLLLSISIQENPSGSGNCDRELTAMAIDTNGVSGTRNTVMSLGNSSCGDGEYFAAAFAPIDSTLTPNGRYLVGVRTVKAPLYMLNQQGERVQVKPETGETGYEIAFDADAEIPINLDIAFGYRKGNAQDPVFLVIWGEKGNKYFDGQQWTGIYGGVVEADLDDYSGEVNNFTFPISLQWAHLAQSTYAETWNPRAGYNPQTGRFVVIWRETPGPSPDPRDLAANNHIRGETLYTLERNWPDGNFLISSDIAAADPGFPVLAASAPSALAVWQDNRNNTTAMSDIYGSLINPRNKTVHDLRNNSQGWSSVAAGYLFTLGIRTDGSLWAWGNNTYGKLGLGDTTERHAPTRVGAWSDWLAVSDRGWHSIGIRADGSLWAWGRNDFGQLGLGDTTERHVPTRVGAWSDWLAVSAGDSHSLGIRADGSLWAWGNNNNGKLGLGDTTDRHVATRVGTWNDWVSVVACANYSLGIRADGSLWAWGFNDVSQLGLGDTTERHVPTQVGTGSDWLAVTSDYHHSLGIRAGGSLWAWGENGYGQLGLGYRTPKDTPTRVGTGNNWASVAAGAWHSLGIRADGSLWAWGGNLGNLGLGNTTERDIPTRVGTWHDWIYVSAGYYRSLGIRADGSLWAWGDNEFGQLGLGDTRDRYVPTLVGGKFPWPMFLPAMIRH